MSSLTSKLPQTPQTKIGRSSVVSAAHSTQAHRGRDLLDHELGALEVSGFGQQLPIRTAARRAPLAGGDRSEP